MQHIARWLQADAETRVTVRLGLVRSVKGGEWLARVAVDFQRPQQPLAILWRRQHGIRGVDALQFGPQGIRAARRVLQRQRLTHFQRHFRDRRKTAQQRAQVQPRAAHQQPQQGVVAGRGDAAVDEWGRRVAPLPHAAHSDSPPPPPPPPPSAAAVVDAAEASPATPGTVGDPEQEQQREQPDVEEFRQRMARSWDLEDGADGGPPSLAEGVIGGADAVGSRAAAGAGEGVGVRRRRTPWGGQGGGGEAWWEEDEGDGAATYHFP